MGNFPWVRPKLGAAALVSACLVFTGVAAAATRHDNTTTSTTSTTQSATGPVAGSWSVPNADAQNTRDVSSPINASNVSKLKVAWKIPITGKYGFSSTPVFSPDGSTVYLQNLASNVLAVNTNTGKIEWQHKFPTADANGEGPNGVSLVNGDLYGETRTGAFALSASTGEQLWATPKLALDNGQGFNEAPLVVNGVMYVSNSGASNGGDFYAINAKNGKVMWKFAETKDASNPNVCGMGCGGGWGTPLMGPNGDLYMGTANPYRSVEEGVNHPSKELYDDSTVALNPKNGKLKWYFQAVPNDFFDWDMELSPMWASSGPGGQPTVIDGGKMGYVYAMNANSGKVIWKRSVGTHSGADNIPLLALEHKVKLSQFKFPYKYCPSVYGGPEESMALAGKTIYISTNKACSVFSSATTQFASGGAATHPIKSKGNIEAISLDNGKVLWNRNFSHSAFGGATVTNDLVFTTTYTGKVIAMNRANGKIVWQQQMSAGTNSALAIDNGTLVTAAGVKLSKGQKGEIVAYHLPQS
jgi:outer membrane protein assembly factor BamB